MVKIFVYIQVRSNPHGVDACPVDVVNLALTTAPVSSLCFCAQKPITD